MVNHYDKLYYVDEWVITRLQSGNWDQEISDEDIEEIGNSGIVETIIDPIVPNTVTLNTNDWGSTDFLAQLMGEFADVDGTDPYSISSVKRNDWIVNSSDMKVQEVDISCRIRDDLTGNLDRTVWLPSAYITSINWSYSVDGNATENVTLRADTDRHFVGEFKDAYVAIGTFDTTATFTVVPTAAAFTELYMTVNDSIYDAATYISDWTTLTVTVTGITLAATDRIRLFYYRSSPADTFTELNTAELGAIKGSYVKIGLGDAGTIISSTKTLRLQSVDVNVTVTREDLKELGTTEIISKSMKKQEVAIDCTVLEEDLANYAYMLGVTASEWTNRASTGVEMKIQDSIGNSQVMYISVYDDANQSTLLKRLTVTNLRLTSSPFSLDVGGTGQYSMSLKADNWSWAGQGEVGRLDNDGTYPSVWVGTSTTSSTTS